MSELGIISKATAQAICDAVKEQAGITEGIPFDITVADRITAISTEKPEQEKTVEITSNGTTEITPDEGYALSKVIVNVEAADSALPIEVSTEAEMTALLESGEVGGVYKYTGETTETYENGSLYAIGEQESADALAGTWVFNNTVTISVSGGSQITYNVNFTTGGGSYTADCIKLVNTGEPYYSALAYQMYYCGGNMGDKKVYSARYSDANSSWNAKQYRTITITSTLAEVTNGEALLTWLQANATKQTPPKVFIKLIEETDLEEITITENGEYTPSGDGYSKVTVSVADSATPIEVSTETEMTALLTSGEVGGVYKYVGTTGTYENGALYMLDEEESVTLISFTIDGTSYQAEDGMTWAEWCESDYNTTNLAVSESYVYGANGYVVDVEVMATYNNRVLASDNVTQSFAYYTTNSFEPK